jgi:hypothetical protein
MRFAGQPYAVLKAYQPEAQLDRSSVSIRAQNEIHVAAQHELFCLG